MPGEEGPARMRTIYRSLRPDSAAGQGGAECFLLRTGTFTVYRLLHLFALRLSNVVKICCFYLCCICSRKDVLLCRPKALDYLIGLIKS